MNRSESIKELAMALSKFQGEVTNPKNTARNPQFNSRYAPLQDILSLVRPLLSKQGLSILQTTTGDLENVTITTLLLHESGEYIETDPFTLRGEQTTKGGAKVLNVQGAGSMITYIRRYQISAILGLSSEDDDDGNHASGKFDKPSSAPTSNKTLSEAQLNRLYAIAHTKGYDKNTVISTVKKKCNCTVEEMTKKQYDDICNGFETAPSK
jgi:hypothetical protein